MNNDILELDEQLQKEKDTKKRIDLMNTYAWNIRRLQGDKSLSLCSEANKLSVEISYDIGFAESYLCMAVHDAYADNHNEALKKCIMAQRIFEEHNHLDGRIRVYNCFGFSCMKLGKYDKALEAFTDGLALSRETGNEEMIVFFLNNIGEVYKDTINAYDEALEYYFQAADYCEKSNLSIYGMINSNMGECYEKLGDTSKALEYAYKGLTKATEFGDQASIAYSYHVIGITYSNMGDIRRALENLQLSLAFRRETNSKFGEAVALSEIGNLYLTVGDPARALENLLEALSLAEEINAEFILGNIHKLAAEAFEQTGDLENSLQHYKKHIEFNSKTVSQELETKISALTADSKLQQAKKDAEIYKLKNVELREKSEEIANKAKELEESYNNIAIISEIGQKITSSLDIETIMNTIYHSVNTLMDATVFGVGLYDEANRMIEYKTFIENFKRLPLFRNSVDDEHSFAAKCIRTGKEVFVNNLILDENVLLIPDDGQESASKPSRSLIYCPLIIENRIIGTVTVQSYRENAYTQHNLNTLKALASYISIALNNSHKNEELRSTLANLQDTQEYLIQSEKMAALGQLISGIAHEINTPLGAIQASINNISEYVHHTIGEKLPKLFKILDGSMLQLFFDMLHSSLEKDVTISSKDERRYRKVLYGQLEDWMVDNSDSIADTLVDMGIYGEVVKYIPLFRHEENQFILQVCYELSGILRNIMNMDIAVGKASKMLYALKNYAHYDHTEIPVEADIKEGIETVLALYHNNMKHGVQIVKNYGPIPKIKCFPDELNQVWTNLIHNSLQSMEYKGTLEIATWQEENNVAVRVADSGAGIPAEIMDKIFDPFFTTKKQGEGSGLGLGIVKKIVNKHHGEILVESKPGRTSFTIKLPID